MASKTTLKRLQKPIPSRHNPNSFQKNFHEYMETSTFHGLNYVGDTKLTLTERLFFLLAFLLVSALSTYFISIMWMKWTATPVIVSTSPTTTSISEIPFPATTICNMNQAKKSAAKDIKPETLEDLQLKTLCMRNDELIKNHNFTSSFDLYKEFLLRMTQPCEEMLVMCKYGNQLMDCLKLFETVLTDDGLCCTFNRVHPKYIQKDYRIEDDFVLHDDGDSEPVEWDPENGYGSAILTESMYPRVAAGPGSAMGLTLILYSNYDDYYCSSTNSAGFKLLLHNPIETPLVQNFGFLIRTGHHSRLAITPNMPSASTLIQSVPKYERQCMFNFESNSTYFRSYTKNNCELECKSRIIEQQCGCVLHFLPRLDKYTKVCSLQDAHCYERISLAIDSLYYDAFHCECLPACFAVNYRSEISMTRFNVSGLIEEPAMLIYNSTFSRNNIAMVDIFYDDTIAHRNVKSQFVGFTDFLSGTGGLLSLFMGFSFISIIEIFYYATIRPYYKSKKLRANGHIPVTIGEPKLTWKHILNMDN